MKIDMSERKNGKRHCTGPVGGRPSKASQQRPKIQKIENRYFNNQFYGHYQYNTTKTSFLVH